MKRELTHGSLFSGVEGFGLGAALAGIKTEWSCEFEDYQTKVIKKILEMDTQYIEILERLKTRHLLASSAVDSLARTSALLEKAQELRGAGLDYGGQMHRIIGEVRPDYVIIENSPLLRKRGFEYVLHGLSEIGYGAQWQCLQGSFLGLQQRRERIYIIAYPVCKFGERESPKSVFREPYLPGGTSKSLSGMGRATGFTRTQNFRKH